MGPPDTWDGMASWLKELSSTMPQTPEAMVVISAHWEESEITINTTANPTLLYDYYGFPKETYAIKYDAPGSPQLASRVRELLKEAEIPCSTNSERGLDHGVFVPLKLVYPGADIPIEQISLKSGSIQLSDLSAWNDAPSARAAHPREEHLIPLMVVAGGANQSVGKRIFSQHIMNLPISGFQFG